MKRDEFEKHRFAFIIIIAVLMLAVILIVGENLKQVSPEEPEEAVLGYEKSNNLRFKEIRSEAGVFKGQQNLSRFAEAPQSLKNKRNLKKYYKIRQYSGSPPFIPHPIDSDMQDGLNSCLSCHKEGGYVAAFKSYAPVTPHPEFVNCRQCHVTQNTESLFRDSLWETISPPKIKRSALPGGPPPIPHSLQMRSNCLSCHAGPAAVFEIRSSHPERINCRQCHVPSVTEKLFVREVITTNQIDE